MSFNPMISAIYRSLTGSDPTDQIYGQFFNTMSSMMANPGIQQAMKYFNIGLPMNIAAQQVVRALPQEVANIYSGNKQAAQNVPTTTSKTLEEILGIGQSVQQSPLQMKKSAMRYPVEGMMRYPEQDILNKIFG